MLTEVRQLSGKIESEEGVAEVLAAADAKTQVYTPKFSCSPDPHDSNPARAGGSSQPQGFGKVPAFLAFQVRLRGSGTATTDPDWIKYLRCCGFSTSLLKSIAIGAVTSGPFKHGETISGGTSGAIGRVIFNTANGAEKIYYVLISTTDFQSAEAITGSTSGASASSSGSPASAGRAYEPILSSIPSLTAGHNQDGYFEQAKGARGSVKLSVAAGQPWLFDFDFKGVDAGQSDAVFFSGVAYETTQPPVFKDAAVLLDAYVPMLKSLECDLGVKLYQRDDVTDAKGILSYGISGRAITGVLSVEKVAAATFDYRGKYHAGTEIVLDITIGATSGNKFRFYMPRVQITKIEDTESDGLAGLAVSFQANGDMDKDNDFVIVQL